MRQPLVGRLGKASTWRRSLRAVMRRRRVASSSGRKLTRSSCQPRLYWGNVRATHWVVVFENSDSKWRNRSGGFLRHTQIQAERLRHLLSEFSKTTTQWVARTLPQYSRGWQLDRVSFRPEEEATRRLRMTARNDLLHVDAFPSRPTNGWRILRVFANVNLTEPRIWITSDPFAKLLERYGEEVGLPTRQVRWTGWLQRGMLGLFHSARRQRSVYDEFMLRFHDFLKTNDEFQERCT